MTRGEQRKRRQRRAIRRAAACIAALLFLISCVVLLSAACSTDGDEPVPETPTPEATQSSYIAPSVELPVYHKPAIDPLEDAKIALAKMVWGEARGCSTTEQAAVIWCVLNRFDSDDPFYANCRTIYDIVVQEGQFHGYDPSYPVEADILALVEDVLARWEAERYCIGDVGRVLPAEYLYFSGDGEHNYFRDQYDGGNTWRWTLDSPYEEG